MKKNSFKKLNNCCIVGSFLRGLCQYGKQDQTMWWWAGKLKKSNLQKVSEKKNLRRPTSKQKVYFGWVGGVKQNELCKQVSQCTNSAQTFPKSRREWICSQKTLSGLWPLYPPFIFIKWGKEFFRKFLTTIYGRIW